MTDTQKPEPQDVVEPREFWVGICDTDRAWHISDTMKTGADWHMVEYSAYAKLQAESDELRERWLAKYDELQAELAEARAALLGDCEAAHVKVEAERDQAKEDADYWRRTRSMDLQVANDYIAKIKAELAEARAALAEATDVINETNSTIGQFTHGGSILADKLNHVFNVNARFLSKNPKLHNAYISKLDSLRESLAVAVEALEFYGNIHIWEWTTVESTRDGIGCSDFSHTTCITGPVQVGGKKAREALATIKAKHGKL